MPLLSPSLAPEMDVLARYDAKLDEVNRGYLALLQERLKVEEQYADGLARLYAKSRAFDSWYDDTLPHPLPTSRMAWREIRELTEREAEARKAFIAALDDAVIRHLADVRDTQTRIRARIKSDLKLANEMYIEQAEHKVPKLKRQYFKKCAEVEEQKKQEAAIALQAKLLSDPIRQPPRGNNGESPSSSTKDLPTDYPHYLAAGHGGTPPTVSDPLPPSSNPAAINIDHEALVSGGGGGGRKRSGSTNQQEKAKEVLNEIALQGKRQINAFISRFGGGGSGGGGDRERGDEDLGVNSLSSTVGSGSGPGAATAAGGPPTHTRYMSSDGGRPSASASASSGHVREGSNVKPSALKGVKLKREAEEADKAYREAVFHLETLRLRRNKIQDAANTSYDEFSEELCNTLKATMMAYSDCLNATSSTVASFCEQTRPSIAQIDTVADVMAFGSNRKGASSGQIPPTLYENFYVGPCRSLIFGVSLNDYDYARGEGKQHGTPPRVIVKCIAELDKRALEVEGIHRISGRQQAVQALVHRIEQDEEALEFSEKDEVFTISAVLKQYCRQLPEPIFHFPLQDRVRYTENRESHISSNFSAFRARLNRMPAIHQSTFRLIVEHLARVAANSSKNKMDAKNLAVIFGKTLFGEDDLPKNGDLSILAAYLPGKDTVAEDLITYAPLLFADEAIDAPVLPAGSSLTRAGSLLYDNNADRAGSSHTRAKLAATRQDSSASSASSEAVVPPTLDRTPSTDDSIQITPQEMVAKEELPNVNKSNGGDVEDGKANDDEEAVSSAPLPPGAMPPIISTPPPTTTTT